MRQFKTNVELGEALYECPFPKCDVVPFKTIAYLENHMIKYHGVAPEASLRDVIALLTTDTRTEVTVAEVHVDAAADVSAVKLQVSPEFGLELLSTQ